MPVSLFAFFALCAATCLAQSDKPEALPEATLRTSSVAVFKSGLGFFIRQGTSKLAGGQAIIPLVPDAALGTLWLAPSDAGTSLEELVAYRYKVSKQHRADSLEDLLRINAGKKITITFNGQEYTGQVLGFSESTSDQSPVPVPLNRALVANNVWTPGPSRLLLLKTDTRVLALNPANVQLVSMAEPPNLFFQQDEEAKALRFHLKGAGQTANLTMGYLQKGVGWTPSYLVSLLDEKAAHITMQAVLTNDVEDISNAEVVFVVGVPNFQFADMWSPMALRQSLAEFMQGAASQSGNRQMFSNALTSQRVNGMITANEDSTVSFSANVDEPQGAPEEDLFLYKRPNVTLAKGERATYNIFAADVACEHLYEWEVTDNPRVDAYGNPMPSYQNNTGGSEKLANVVWHSLRLKNSTRYPWTSGPAMVVSGVQALSQDTLVYTPKGATTNLKMTVATDVRVDKKELEVDRQPRVLQRNGNYYDSVTVEGTLKLKNFKTKDIHLIITRSFVGEVLTADGGHVEKLAEVIRQLNPTSRVSWDLPFKADEEKTITYRYKILIRD